MWSRIFACIALTSGLGGLGCSASPSNTGTVGGMGGSPRSSDGGSTGTGGAATAAGGSTGTGGDSGMGGAGGQTSGSGGAAQGGSSGGTGGTAGGASMSPGCGMTPPTPVSMIGTSQFGKFMLNVTAQSVLQFNATPGANQQAARQYFVRLPDNYDSSRPYRVIYLGPGCSPQQDTLTIPIRQPPLETDPNSTGARSGAILVQLQQGTYNPAAYNAANCRVGNTSGCNATSAYCFDDWASEVGTPQVASIPDGPSGAVAMERAYFAALHTAIENAYCVDQSRQFYAGYSSGGWLAQQLGCWFPDVLRAQANVTGGIPPVINANVMGTNNYCGKHPLGYFSIHNNPDASNQFQGSVDGARRVFALNGCTGTFPVPPLPNAATLPIGLEVFQITNAAGAVLVPNNPNNFRCYHYTTCPAAYPMYFCVSTDQGHDAQGTHAAPAFWEFFSRF
jgi:hypothetical protein